MGASTQVRPMSPSISFVSWTIWGVYSAVWGPSFFAASMSPASTAASHRDTASIFLSFLSSKVPLFRSSGFPSKTKTGSIPSETIIEALSRKPMRWATGLPS